MSDTDLTEPNKEVLFDEETETKAKAKAAVKRATTAFPEWRDFTILPLNPERRSLMERIAILQSSEGYDQSFLLAGSLIAVTTEKSSEIKKLRRVSGAQLTTKVFNFAEKHVDTASKSERETLDNLIAQIYEDAQATAVGEINNGGEGKEGN